jgi:Ca2+-dependent lipid-binding protein
METIFVVLRSLDDTLTLTLFDRHERRKHTLLGVSTYKLSKLRQDRAQGGVLLSLLKSEKTRGELLIDLIYYPLTHDLDSKHLCKYDGISLPHSPKVRWLTLLALAAAGVVSLTLPQARNLDASGSRSGFLSPFARVCLDSEYNDVPILVTNRCRHTLNPTWLAQLNFYCARKETCVITVQVIDAHLDDPVVGHLSLWLDDLLDGNETGVEWWPMSGCRTGEVMVRAAWRPVDLHSY